MKYSHIAAAIFAFLLFRGSIFVVNQVEQAVITRFGDPVRVIKDPGLHVKIPFIEEVVFFETRLMNIELPALEITLGDKRRIMIDAFGRYRITDPLKFYKSVGNYNGVMNRLYPIVLGSLSSVLGKVGLPSLLSDTRISATNKIKEEINKASKGFGIVLSDAYMRRTDLPPQNSEAICKRMISEREREAKELRAKGFEIAKEIKSKADKENLILLAEAEAKAQQSIADGELEAGKIYLEAFSKDKEFFEFFQSLEAYKEAFDAQNTTFVLSPKDEFFKYFKKAL